MTKTEFIAQLKVDVGRFAAYWTKGEEQETDPFPTTNEEPEWFEFFAVFLESDLS